MPHSPANIGTMPLTVRFVPIFTDAGLAAKALAPRAGLVGVVEEVRAGATLWGVTTREMAEQVLRELPEEKVPAALEALRQLDPVVALRDVSLEDEELSPEEEAAVQEARDELAAGVSTISHEEIKREFGLDK